VGLATRARDGRGIAAPTHRLARWCSSCSSSPGASPPPATRRCSPCSSRCSPSPALAPPTTSGGWAGPWPPCSSGAPPQARAGTRGSGTGRQRWPREGVAGAAANAEKREEAASAPWRGVVLASWRGACGVVGLCSDWTVAQTSFQGCI
jgi:hypothetical protein